MGETAINRVGRYTVNSIAAKRVRADKRQPQPDAEDENDSMERRRPPGTGKLVDKTA
jgi:hypothetical protein